MKIEKIVCPVLDENCYLLIINKDVLIVDPGSGSNIIKKFIQDNNLNVLGFLITHYHYDHVGALRDLMDEYNDNVYDFKVLGCHSIKEFSFEIISTYGHTEDSVSFYFKNDNIMFSGDFLFYRSIGTLEFGGNKEAMINSIKKIKLFNKDIKIFPGHGDYTFLKDEILCNPFFGDDYLW
ncbi:MAG: MBL fold metallo-hydrolase [Bacilli bacterium]